jgi:DNA-binding LacI/PurR family transcriptional regulator
MNLASIAERAGVSKMTVSRVLRNYPYVKAHTRQRVLDVVAQMNYRPNPAVSVLMSYMANARKPTYRPTLVYAWEHNSIRTKKDLEETWGGYYRGVVRRADELGFNVEPMRINETGMSHRRFSDILKARNIPGVFIAPAEEPQASYAFDWSVFSAVTFGYSLRQPRLNRVCLNYHAGIRHALRTLAERGYRRFGLILAKDSDERIQHLWCSGFLTWHWEMGLQPVPEILISPSLQEDEFKSWFLRNEPEVILSYNDCEYVNWARELRGGGHRCEPCRFVHLDGDFIQHPENLIGYVESCRPRMANAAVELLAAQIKQSEMGIPESQKSVVIEPKFEFATPGMEVRH